MTRRDILFNTDWDEFDMGTCKLFVTFFNQYIPFIFFQNHQPTPNLTDKMILSLNHILTLEKESQALYFDTFQGGKAPKIQEIHIDQDNDKFESIYAEIIMQPIDNQYLSLIVKDACIIHLDKKGNYLDTLNEG